MRYQIEELDKAGNTVAVISGLGRNKGTWDAQCKSRRTALRWLREMRRLHPTKHYTIAEG